MNSVNIFIENKRIVITPAKNKPFFISAYPDLLHCKGSETKKIPVLFKRLIAAPTDSILLITGEKRKTLKFFTRIFPTIEAAGGLIENSQNEFLFIYRNGKWDLPKGKIDKYESAKKAAVRECVEECGLTRLTLNHKLDVTFHMYRMSGKWILKKTHWYYMSSAHTGKLIPQKEEGITKAEWINKSGLKKVLRNTYPSIREVIVAAEVIKN